MAAGYTKELLIDAFIWRYQSVLENWDASRTESFIKMVSDFYDKVGKEKFRVWCSLDAAEIKKFRLVSCV